jgi:3',5'-cyclic AMP phosphodiesterase CpdA
VVSDSHLSRRTPEALSNWDAVVDHIAADRPDLVVHAGDVSTDGAERADDLDFARAQLRRSAPPVHVVPGNHDLGDNPHAGPHGPLIDAERLARYRDALRPDRWTVDIPGWRLVGLNSLLFGSGLDDEAEQWDWWHEQLAVGRHRRVALILHKPILPCPSLADDTDPGRYVPPETRRRLLVPGVRLVVSGHAHQFCRHRTDGATHVWVPSTWAVIPDRFQPAIGDKVCGVVELVLHQDGTCETELMLPYGIEQQAIVDDVADPYAHAT